MEAPRSWFNCSTALFEASPSEFAPDSAPDSAPASDTGTPVAVPPTVMFDAPMTWTAAMFRFPATRMPASPAFTVPLGRDQVDESGRLARDRHQLPDTATGDIVHGAHDSVAVRVGLDHGRRRGRCGLGTFAGIDVAVRRPQDDIAAFQCQDAGLVDVEVFVREAFDGAGAEHQDSQVASRGQYLTGASFRGLRRIERCRGIRHAHDHRAAWRQQIDVATLLGLQLG